MCLNFLRAQAEWKITTLSPRLFKCCEINTYLYEQLQRREQLGAHGAVIEAKRGSYFKREDDGPLKIHNRTFFSIQTEIG